MSVVVDVKLDVESMADFMIYQIYSSISGVVALVLGFLNLGLTVAFARQKNYFLMAVFLVFAFLILFAFPMYIRHRVGKLKDSKRMTEVVTYEFAEDGIITTTAEDTGKASWARFKKAASKKRIIMLFDDKKNAIILPVDRLGEDYTAVVDLIYDHMPAPAVRIRRLDGKKRQDEKKDEKK